MIEAIAGLYTQNRTLSQIGEALERLENLVAPIAGAAIAK